MHHQCNNPEQRVDDADPDQPPHRRKTRPGHAQDQQRDFVLDEFYESPAGVVEHWRLAVETWQELTAFMEWSGKAKRVSTLHSGTLFQALW